MRMATSDIVLNLRVRKNLGDISTLMDSMKKHGLLNPITVTRKGELIAGQRRLESAKRLGWQYIEVKVVNDQDEIDKLELEIEENMQRKSLTPDELADAYRRLEKLKNPGFFQRVVIWLGELFKRLFKKRRQRSL
jgi:ParB family transcriptional regulator, chromosome partitioning protein